MNEPDPEPVDLSKLRPGPIRHKSLSPGLLEHIEAVHDVVGPYLDTTLEQFEIGFMRDANPEDEVAVWCSIALHHAGADPRHDLRQQDDLSDDEINDMKNRLARMDTRSSSGPWTTTTLKLIAKNPGKRATELAEAVKIETKRFKTNVRKLKELGLTESLKVGYRLSPRGEVVFEQVES
jgi:hypothetical protein